MGDKCSTQGCVASSVVGISAFLYILLGVLILVMAAATLFTPFGQIITPFYAASGIGGGITITMIGFVGLFAVCDSEHVGRLWLFTLLTLCMVIGTIAATVVMFQYETLLRAAALAGGQGGATQVRVDVSHVTHAVSVETTQVVRELATNAFVACNASIIATNVPDEYNFDCANGYFDDTASMINASCMMPESYAVNLTVGSVFHRCYDGPTFASWPVPTPLNASSSGSPSGSSSILAVLNTPRRKGLGTASRLRARATRTSP